MRVVFLTHNYPRNDGDVAGAFLRPLVVALAGRGHAVSVVAPSDSGRGGEDRLDGVLVQRVRYADAGRERYAYTGRMQEALRSPAGWWAVASMVRALRAGARQAAGAGPAVVHAHWWFPAGLAAPPELPAVVTLHGTDARLLERPGAPALARLAFRKGRVVTAVSAAVAGIVGRRTGFEIDSSRIQPMPVEDRGVRSTGGGGLVFVGRLTAQKRVQLALEAHAAMLAERPDLNLTIVGDGPARPDLEGRTQALGSSARVRFLGQLPPAASARVLGTADLFLFPAGREGFGLAVVEALMAGVPVVACRDGGGVSDILAEPGSGMLVDPTAAAIAEAARRLLADPGARGAAAAAGLAWRERLAPEAVAERCETWYRAARVG